MLKELNSYEDFLNRNKPEEEKKEKLILEQKRDLINEWYERDVANKKNNKPIIIKLKLVSEKETIIFEYSLFKEIESHAIYDKNNKLIFDIDNAYFNKIKKWFQGVYFIEDNRVLSYDINKYINYLINVLNKKSVIEIINIADKNIKNLILDKNNEVENYVLSNGSRLTSSNLSDGTKKFMYYFYYFWKILNKKNDYGKIIFIDEIEMRLHYSLVEFFKKLIQKKSSDNYSQLFFTSHNINSLSMNLSHKQIFFLVDDFLTGGKKIEKVSSFLKPTNSVTKKYIEEKIGSHPLETKIEYALDLLDEI